MKNPPASAGNMRLIPGPEGPQVPRGKQASGSYLLSLCSEAREPQLLKPLSATEARTARLERGTHSPQPETSPGSSEDPGQPKVNVN